MAGKGRKGMGKRVAGYGNAGISVLPGRDHVLQLAHEFRRHVGSGLADSQEFFLAQSGRIQPFGLNMILNKSHPAP